MGEEGHRERRIAKKCPRKFSHHLKDYLLKAIWLAFSFKETSWKSVVSPGRTGQIGRTTWKLKMWFLFSIWTLHSPGPWGIYRNRRWERILHRLQQELQCRLPFLQERHRSLQNRGHAPQDIGEEAHRDQIRQAGCGKGAVPNRYTSCRIFCNFFHFSDFLRDFWLFSTSFDIFRSLFNTFVFLWPLFDFFGFILAF